MKTQTVEQVFHQILAQLAMDALGMWFALQVAIIMCVLVGATWMCLKNSFFKGSLKEYEHYH